MNTSDAESIEQLTELNERYLDSYRNGGVEFFSNILAPDFKETAVDGTVLDKSAFLEKITARIHDGPRIGVQALELEIQLFAETAIVRAIPRVTDTDGTVFQGGRYTDVYVRMDGQWCCVAAHLGGS